ncbi:MAG: thiamine pyrophosphate-dependent enzyme [Pseudomonadota bacterium]
MMGNEAIALGLIEGGCQMVTSYPGTPASEILGAVARFAGQRKDPIHIQWAVNEKVALEIAYAAAQSGLRAAVSMKQVGLNVASDPLMSAAYMGTAGGFVVISADDPGPHSSQTEQDSRLWAMMAKIPVLDPADPKQAREMARAAFDLSERYKIPVMLRPTTRVCHCRQDITPGTIPQVDRLPKFEKDPLRWAATPKFRFKLHGELEEKLAAIAADGATAPVAANPEATGPLAVIASGAAAAHAREVMTALGVWTRIPFYQVLQPFPLHTEFVERLIATYERILVIEETTGVMEMQIADRHRTRGKLTGTVPRVGELLPETIARIVADFAGIQCDIPQLPAAPGRRPTLCAGCPHRASFYAIKKAAPKGIYTSDIGCYTLGLNLGAVDTVLCMGAAISQAAGFYHAHKHLEKPPPVVATIGDSTFFHAGVPALIDAVVQNVAFVLVILDNRTTAMTGNQPTPSSGVGIRGESLGQVDIASLVTGCGVRFCRTGDPYHLDDFIGLLKEALSESCRSGPAVVIARHPCILDSRRRGETPAPVTVTVSENCDGCGYCVDHFECPALVLDKMAQRVMIDPLLCIGCGVCLSVCPKHSLETADHREAQS